MKDKSCKGGGEGAALVGTLFHGDGTPGVVVEAKPKIAWFVVKHSDKGQEIREVMSFNGGEKGISRDFIEHIFGQVQ